jgi:hypothetical protein
MEEDPQTYEAILKSMEGLPGYSENGKLDAQRNYEIAERNYYKGMYRQTQNPTTAFQDRKQVVQLVVLPPCPVEPLANPI